MFEGGAVAAALKSCGVTHVVWVPDSELGCWEPALSGDAELRLVRVCREGEAIALAGGLTLGGRRPVVVIQCTGLFEAGDALRNMVHDLGLPLFFLIGVRSWRQFKKGQSMDTCPLFTLPILDAWRLSYTWLEDRHTPADLADLYRKAQGGSPRRRRASPGVTPMAMTTRQALEVLARHRGDRIVVTTMTAVGVWPGFLIRRSTLPTCRPRWDRGSAWGSAWRWPSRDAASSSSMVTEAR